MSYPSYSSIFKDTLVFTKLGQDIVKNETSFKRAYMAAYMYLAYTSAQVIPLLPLSRLFSKSSPYQIRNSWPEERSRGFFKPVKIICLEFEVYPGIV